jgi:hypothetical protein
MPVKPRQPRRFNVGDQVRITSRLRRRLANKTAVVISVLESRHAHTLDKYIVRPIGEESEFLVWDIELTKIE